MQTMTTAGDSISSTSGISNRHRGSLGEHVAHPASSTSIGPTSRYPRNDAPLTLDAITRKVSRALGFETQDEIVAVFCGSKKTLASGMPMAKLLFGGNAAMGVLILPIMLYHQMQLFACAVLARRYAARVSHEVVRHDAAS